MKIHSNTVCDKQAKYYRCFKCGYMFNSEKWIPAWMPKQEAHWISGKGTCRNKVTEITKEDYYKFKNNDIINN